MWVTKNGQTQVIDDETLPYWRSQGWVEWQPDAAAEAATAPAWAATTPYVAGQLVWQAGQLYRAKADFTSGGSFVAGNWDAVGSAASSAVTGAFQTYAVGATQPGLGATLALIAWSENPADVYTTGTPGVAATGNGKVTFTADGTYSIALTRRGLTDATNRGVVISVSDNFVTGDGLVFFNAPVPSLWSGLLTPTSLQAAEDVITLPPLPFKAGDWIEFKGKADDATYVELRVDVVRIA